jgi:hypothetical protein
MYIRQFALIISVFFICKSLCAAGDNDILLEHFFRLCYQLPYNPETEMSDVTLVNASYHDQAQIEAIINAVLHKYSSVHLTWTNELLSSAFINSRMNENAIIRLFRERVIGRHYRLDMQTHLLDRFATLSWDNSQLTNKYPFGMIKISDPPDGTNKLWALYCIQPFASHVDLETGSKPMHNEAFYLSLYGLPPLIRLNAILKTMDLESIPKRDLTDDPTYFQYFKLSDNRLNMIINGHGDSGNWKVSLIDSNNSDVKQISYIDSDGVDRNRIRIIFNAHNPEQKYLAYVRDANNGKIGALFAWDYNNNGVPIRFLNVEPSPNGKLKASAEYIINASRSTNIEWSIFNVNISEYSSVYDKRPEYPIETVNGKVVFDAGKDKYASLPSNVAVRPNWFDGRTVIRAIMFTVLLLPPLVMLFRAIKKQIYK